MGFIHFAGQVAARRSVRSPAIVPCGPGHCPSAGPANKRAILLCNGPSRGGAAGSVATLTVPFTPAPTNTIFPLVNWIGATEPGRKVIRSYAQEVTVTV